MLQLKDALIYTDAETLVTDLRRICAEDGVQLFHTVRQNGNNIQTNCPFHKDGQERKPSFGINFSKNVCHCFTCNWSGTVDKFVSEVFGYNDGGEYGKRWLKRHYDTTSIETRELKFNFSRTKDNHTTTDYISEDELDSYRFIHPYMYQRKLTDDIIELFDIGYDAKTDCLTFPIRDINGNCLFVARRSVKTKFFNYPKEVEKPLYGLYELHHVLMSEANPSWALHELRAGKAKEIIVCESMLDATTCWVYGKYAVALNGLGNDLQFKQLSELQCRKLILATDNDERGLMARQRIRRNVKNKIITEIDPKSFPAGAKDINDLSKEQFDALWQIL